MIKINRVSEKRSFSPSIHSFNSKLNPFFNSQNNNSKKFLNDKLTQNFKKKLSMMNGNPDARKSFLNNRKIFLEKINKEISMNDPEDLKVKIINNN